MVFAECFGAEIMTNLQMRGCGDRQGGEAQIKRNPALLALGVLVKSCS